MQSKENRNLERTRRLVDEVLSDEKLKNTQLYKIMQQVAKKVYTV